MSKTKNDKKFKTLDEEWCNSAQSMNREEIDNAVRTAAMNMVALEAAKELDEDLASLKEQVKVAGEIYTQGRKENLLKIEFLVGVLRGRGIEVPDAKDFAKKIQAE